jgi:hypothetical protein
VHYDTRLTSLRIVFSTKFKLSMFQLHKYIKKYIRTHSNFSTKFSMYSVAHTLLHTKFKFSTCSYSILNLVLNSTGNPAGSQAWIRSARLRLARLGSTQLGSAKLAQLVETQAMRFTLASCGVADVL